MFDPLAATRNLLETSAIDADTETLRQKFLASYKEIESGKAPLQSIVTVAFEGLDPNEKLVDLFQRTAGEIASFVDAGIDGTAINDYHNPTHFAKVAINFRALSTIHNVMFPDYALPDGMVASGIFAATCHDLRHNGKGNTVDGVHEQFRLEQLAIDTAKSWIVPRDERERQHLAMALAPIYATDVSAKPGQQSPAAYIRAWHDALMHDRPTPAETAFSATMSRRLNSGSQILIGSLLQDADVFGALIEQEAHLRENARVRTEIGNHTGTLPDAVKSGLWFLETMLEGRETTAAARRFTDDFIRSQIATYKAGALRS